MDRVLNPYSPGAGTQPPELAGRDDLLDDVRVAIQRLAAGRSSQGLMIIGLRGVGKTVIVNRAMALAEDERFQVVKIEAPETGALGRMIIPELTTIMYRLDLIAAASQKLRAAAGALRNFIGTVKVRHQDVEFGFEPTPGVADSGHLDQDLTDLLVRVADATKYAQTGIVLLIDEIQYLSIEELSALVTAYHQTSQRGLPLLVIGAGLPQIVALAGNAKSYAERLFEYPEIGSLSNELAMRALIKPAEENGVKYRKNAALKICELTQGYPYFIQVWGREVWNAAKRSPITIKDVENAQAAVEDYTDRNFFRSRYERVSDLQRMYLRAMAKLGAGPHKTGDIAQAWGTTTNAASPIRAQLIKKGMVWSPKHGETAFTVPMFDQYILRKIPKLRPHRPRRRRKQK